MNLAQALEPTYTLDVQAKKAKHWVIIGAGGTGGYLLPNLLRQISLQNRLLTVERKALHSITIVDADDIEDKNLTRQNFIQRDVGQNKAQVMAGRYGGAFGIEVNFVPEYLDSEDMLQRIVSSNSNIPVVVDCVDNNKTRELIHNVFKKTKGMFSLSSGNEEWAGQVVVGYNAGKQPDKALKTPQFFDLPSVADLYPEILDGTDKLPTEMSCAERAVSNPQNIQTNQTAANLLMGFANTILTANHQEGEGLKSYQVIFNVQAPSFNTTLNKYSNLLIETPKAEATDKEEARTAVAVKTVAVPEAAQKEKEGALPS